MPCLALRGPLFLLLAGSASALVGRLSVSAKEALPPDAVAPPSVLTPRTWAVPPRLVRHASLLSRLTHFLPETWRKALDEEASILGIASKKTAEVDMVFRFWPATVFVAATSLGLNVADVLFLSTFLAGANGNLNGMIYVGAISLTGAVAWIARDLIEVVVKRNPNIPIELIVGSIGPVFLTIAAVVLARDWYCGESPAAAKPPSPAGAEDSGARRVAVEAASSVCLFHVFLITFSTCCDNFALDLWICMQRGYALVPMLLGSFLGVLPLIWMARVVSKSVVVMEFLLSAPLFLVVGCLALVSIIETAQDF